MKITTKQLKTAYLWRYVFTLVLMLCSTAGYAQDLSKAKELCNNITDQNKAMAKHAGYDLDALCSEVSAMASPDREAVPAPEIVSRKTASSSKNMSDANSSGMASGIKAKNTLMDSSFEASEATMEPENGLTDLGLLTDDEFEEQEQEQEQEQSLTLWL